MGCSPMKERSAQEKLEECAASGDLLGTNEWAQRAASKVGDETSNTSLNEALIVASASDKSTTGVVQHLVQLGADVEVP